MLLSSYSVVLHSPGGQGESLNDGSGFPNAQQVLELRFVDGPNFFLTLRSGSSPGPRLDDADLVVLAADIFRVGWRRMARPIPDPLIMGGAVYRGFQLTRDTTLAGYGDKWTVDCLVATQLHEEFNWLLASTCLEEFAAEIFGDGATHG